jgi:hypothetical protein
VFAHAYGADTAALEKLAESPDSNIRNITSGMLQAAPAFASMRHGVASGTLYPGTDLAPDVSAAAAKLSALRESGQTIPDYLKQQGLYGPELTPEAKMLLQAFHAHRASAKRIGAILKNYAAAVEAAGDPKQQGMFGVQSAPTKGELLEAAIHLAAKETHRSRRRARNTNYFPSNRPAMVRRLIHLVRLKQAASSLPAMASPRPQGLPSLPKLPGV